MKLVKLLCYKMKPEICSSYRKFAIILDLHSSSTTTEKKTALAVSFFSVARTEFYNVMSEFIYQKYLIFIYENIDESMYNRKLLLGQ